MLIFLFRLLYFSFFIFLISQILKFLLYSFYVWQLVEYRLDRLKLRFTNLEERSEFFHYLNFLNFYPFNKYPQFTLRIFLSFLIFIFLSYRLLFVIYKFLATLIPFEDKFIFNLLLTLLVIYYLVPLLSSLTILLTAIFFWPLKKLIIYLAKQKIKKNKNLIVIGITGSFGKSTTKEVLAEILALGYKVLKTSGNINTEIGIAKTALFSLNKKHKIFLVEMGAYKRGEIKKICELVSPKIGIITGINYQHYALFGSFKNILEAKYELIESLPQNGLALFNAKDKYCRKLNKRKRPCFSLLYGAKSKDFEESLAAGEFLAQHFKVSKNKLKKIIPKLKKFFLLKKKRGRGGILIFDDSYSSNPEGFKKALSFLAQEKRRKIIVTSGIIELGEVSDKVHRQMGKMMVKLAEKIIVTSQNFGQAFQKGLSKEEQNKFLISRQELKIINYLKDCFNSRWVVLWEGRVPRNIKNIFEKND